VFKLNLKSQAAEESILKMIARDGLKEGDAILSENRIATLLGVSRTTVRQAIGALVEKGVLRSENGRGTFVVKPIAGNEDSRQRSGLIGFVCYGGINNSYMSSIARGIEEKASAAEMQLCVGSVVHGTEQEAEIIRRFLKHGVDGIIISPVESNPPSALFLELCENRAKIVVVDKSIPGISVPSVACDDREGGFLATEYLIKAGHCRIAHICGPRLAYNAQERFEGYRMALERYGLPFDPAIAEFAGEWTVDAGREAIFKLLSLPGESRPTAIFAFNDILALEAWEILKEHGMSVPDDVSLVGYANLREPYEKGLLLTSVDQQPEEIGRQAWLLLDKMLAGELSANSSRLLLKAKLIERGSVRVLPKNKLSA